LLKVTLSEKQKGILFMLLSAFSFAFMQALVGLLGPTVNIWEMLVIRSIINCVVIFILIRRKGALLFGSRGQQPALFARSILGTLGMICMFYAASNGNQADVTILNKTSLFLIAIFAVIFLKEKPSKILLPVLILAFVGTYISSQPAFNTNLLSTLAALGSSIATAFTAMLLRYFRGKSDALTVVFHLSCVTAIMALPGIKMDFLLLTQSQWILLILMGIAGAIGQIMVTLAYQLVPAGEVSVYNYSGIIFSMILGFLILGQPIHGYSVIGGGLLIVASVLMYIDCMKMERKEQAM
jgi:drug/metabolite transporter (DMT)-like permease